MHDDPDQATGYSPQPAGRTPPAPSTPAPPPAPWNVGDLVLGGYRVEGELGEGVGGMGRVYLLANPLTSARFAVKRSKKLDEEHQRKFLFELLTWADLPPHPNLLPFRFFRTDGGEVYLFSDYAEGGSLADWVRQGKMTSVKAILDAAVPFAWGLHVAHEHGIVHRDVKPSNALMTPDGRVMVGDFGLAASRRAVEGPGHGPPASVCVSYGGMTLAYCSPEQARQEEVTRRTDVWSWGVSVLEMFTGRVTWSGGWLAGEALEEHLGRAKGSAGPAVPGWLADVLRRCFRADPGERWETMAALVEALRAGSRAAGCGDLRELAAVPPAPSEVIEHDRRTTVGTTWRDPLLWLREALETCDRDPAEAEGLLPSRGRWRHTRVIADMVAMREAAALLKAAADKGNARAELRWAKLCGFDQAFVHECLTDRLGALPLYDRAIAVYERLVTREGRPEQAEDLAAACVNKANALRSLGECDAALTLYERAIVVYERLVEEDGRADLGDALARACMNKAVTGGDLGDELSALPLYERAIALFERLIEQGGRPELADNLATACMNKAVALTSLGEFRAALSLHGRTIAVYERLVEQDGRDDLADDLARAYMNKAAALDSLGEGRDALPLYDRAIAIHERLVGCEGRADLIGGLAWYRLNRAYTLHVLGHDLDALRPLVRDNVTLLRQEIERTDRADLHRVLCWAEYVFRDLF